MTHRTPDTPEGLGVLLRGLRECASPLSCGGPTDDLALAARALRTALSGADQAAAVADAHQVLRIGRPRAAWARRGPHHTGTADRAERGSTAPARGS
ncbi:hypothetical protein [Streptomyces sp. NPDC051286]|uniref:hypothetical protein n=1 Tax=Streptomyces sp. NPDC051286 TaxID=3365647 RepID=UPI0037A7D3F4